MAPNTGAVDAPQGSAPASAAGVASARQGSAASSDLDAPGAAQGSPAASETGSAGAWRPGAATSEPGWPGGRPDLPGGSGAQGPDQPGPYYFAPPGPAGGAPRNRGRGKVVAGVTALVLAVGGVAGGVGGYLGYQAAEQAKPVTNALNAPPPAQQTGNAPAEGSTEQVAQKVLPTVVQVQVNGGAGSGFVLSSDGLVLTNNHVVESAANGGPIKVQFQDGKSASARIVGRDPSSDLAVVKADGVSGLPTAELGNSGDLRIGQQVVAVGSPFDLNGTVTSGIVSSLNRPVRAGDDGTQATVLNAIQTDAAINPGNSGGPLVNMRGQVVGINSAIYSPNRTQSSQGGSVGIGFAIPVDQARRTAKELSETGKATQTVLGVQVTDGTDGGARVREVTPGGAAEQAGLRAGDLITKFGDRVIDSSDALVAAVRSRAPGETVQLTVGGRAVDVKLGSQPVELR
ncbi:S1C family serine protease [Saccharothrix australiensis]|uniref:Putative serine protease PepD n=1 Tax=Saccharothrix australiensis TaxID=2072 RepID=A0A495VTA5_9PSEU|nr:trypsin-like peptidase domain-containing protein [Saccharothrix australiensis]RKT52454.1 putative serine protease PepD [Saccharothrix australiensis]